MFQLEGLGYNDYYPRAKRSRHLEEWQVFDIDFDAYLKSFDPETKYFWELIREQKKVLGHLRYQWAAQKVHSFAKRPGGNDHPIQQLWNAYESCTQQMGRWAQQNRRWTVPTWRHHFIDFPSLLPPRLRQGKFLHLYFQEAETFFVEDKIKGVQPTALMRWTIALLH